MRFMDRYDYSVPGGFEGHPYLLVLTLFSLIMIVILSLEWFWRVAWGVYENPFPLKHPITSLRILLSGLCLSVVLRVAPDALRLAFWNDLTPFQRLELVQWGHILRVVSLLPFSISWMVGYLSLPMLYYQLERRPLPMHLWPTPDQLKRPLKIGVAVLVISVAITFYG